MEIVILDTNAISALADGDEALFRVLKKESRHHLPVIVVGEYLYGLKRSREKTLREKWLDKLASLSEILDITMKTVSHYARVREELRSMGRPIPENDVWIAALSSEHVLPIVSKDKHFDLITDVRRIDW